MIKVKFLSEHLFMHIYIYVIFAIYYSVTAFVKYYFTRVIYNGLKIINE